MGDKMNFFDLHCDTAFECFKWKKSFYENDLSVSGKRGEAFENWHQIFAIWIRDDEAEPFRFYKNVLNYFETQEMPSNLIPYFSVEGGAVLGDDIDRLYVLKQDKIKILTLTWNGENNIAGGANSEKGLTKFGKKVLNKMNNLELICDLSHLNVKSFFEVAERAEKVIATHSNCYNICAHRRNLSDEQIKIISEKKGLIGLCFYPAFLGEYVLEGLYENVFYLCDKGYEDIIAIGSDFDGGIMDRKLNNISKIPRLYKFLDQKGLEKRLLDKIFYENAYNYIAKNK